MTLRNASKDGLLDEVVKIAKLANSLEELEDRSESLGVNPGQCDGKETSLIQAAYHGHLSCVQALWEHGYLRLYQEKII